ncbi:MAG: HAMP domain-containing sensor histidine kinase [Oscillospiraceae bacterium]|nr:HAMP domain-containing sensor histidine kinase [Oscillospiraceae bacterium]MDD4413016.1 HAMP domain-containing sensor histidine kinase [Oscillospiraceae bacterium]
MFKSIFTKYFTVLSIIIVVSFAAMGGMQMLFSTRYWVADKQALLKENTQSMAQITAQNTTNIMGTYNVIESALYPYLNLMSETIDAYICITDNDGKVILCSKNAVSILGDVTLSSGLMKKVEEGEFFEVGLLDGVYTKRHYTVGEPITLRNGQLQLGYVFASTSAQGLNDYLMNNLKVFFLSALGVMTLTFIALYLMTFRMVRPLRQMAAAARRFGAGDFSSRIPVNGQDEVAELASSLNNMAVSLSSVEGMRRSFIANVSHELKTPMTTIAGFIDGILDGTIPEEKRSYYLKIVTQEVKRLSRLVKSMLDLSQIDNGELNIKPVYYDLSDQVCNILLTFEQRIEGKNIRVTGLEECPRAEVLADFDLIGQVVYNLIDNAIKFINDGGTLTLNISHKDKRVYFTIRNTGEGIPSHEMPHIFERFYKSDPSRSLDKTGMGLGLYIVKTIINLHHGEIKVCSVQGEYCEFEFWLSSSGLPSNFKNDY